MASRRSRADCRGLSFRAASRSRSLTGRGSSGRSSSPISQIADRIVFHHGMVKFTRALAAKSSNKVVEIAHSVTRAAFDQSKRYARLKLEEFNRYQFALIFKGDLAAPPTETLKSSLRRLSRAGISFDILYPNHAADANIHKFVIVMLHMDPSAIEEMSYTLQLERWLNSGCQGIPNHGTNRADLDYSEKIQCGMMVLERAGIQQGRDDIVAVLALPCFQFQVRFYEAHLRQLSWFRLKYFFTSLGPKSRVATDAGSKTELTDDNTYGVGYDYFIFELRRHFGEVVAFNYAFALHFLKWLLVPALIACLIEFASLGLISIRSRAIAVTIFGLATTSIWIPIIIRTWQRKCAELSVYWNTTNVNERAYLNPHNVSKDNMPNGPRFSRRRTASIGRASSSSSNWIYVLPLYVVLFVLQFSLILVATSLFVTAHVSIRAVPSCHQSSSSLCFTNATRWISSSAISVLTGSLMSIFQVKAKSVAVWLAKLENFRLEYEYYKSLIQKTFWMQWISLYSWFITLSFLFVAFGDRLNSFLENNVLSFLAFKTDGQSLDLFEMLVSPIFVSLSFNFAFGTFFPFIHFLMKYRRLRRNLSQPIELQQINEGGRVLADNFASQLRTELNFPIGICCPIRQASYSDIIGMERLPERSGHKDYDDIIVCFGLVASFSAVSPIIVIILCVNALFEVHSGIMKTSFGYRRPESRRARNAGLWEGYLYVCMVLGGLISVGQVCFSTGHLEAFLPNCTLSDGQTPDRKCIPSSYRIVVALLMEHLVVITQALTLSMIDRQPKWIATRLYKIQRLKHKFFRDLKRTQNSLQENADSDHNVQ